MRLVFFHGLLIAVEGLIVLGSLLVEPSQSGGFLGFSIERWAIIFLTLLALMAVLYITYKVWANQTKALETWLSADRHLFWTLFLALALFGFSLPAALGKIPTIRYYAYFGRLRPWLVWLSLVSGQVGLTLLLALCEPILRWFAQFFPLDGPARETRFSTRIERSIVLGTAMVYLVLQLASFAQVRQAEWLPDSIDYIFPAETYRWNEIGFWTHTKPWGAAALFKLTSGSPLVIDAVQTGLSALAWLLLAWVFSRTLRSGRLKVAAFILILGFSLAPPVQMWNHIIQSESLSISLMSLILAAWMSLIQKWRWEKLSVLIILVAWWLGTRETNVYLGLLVAALLFGIGLIYKHQRFYWAVGLLLVLLGYINLQISEVPTIPRWLYPLTNTLLNRILPDEEFLGFFQAKGLPVSPQLLSLSGGLANSGDFAVFNDPALNNVENWLYRRGKEVYILFLLDHPVYTLVSPWQHLPELLSPENISSYASERYAPLVGWLFESFFFLNSLWLLLLLTIIVLVLVVLAKPWRSSPIFWLCLGFWVFFFPHFYLVWHGDAAELSRHAIQASIQLRLGLWLLFFLALDTIVRHDERI